MITPAQRREGKISLAMLPLGAVLVLAAVVGSIGAAALGLSEMIRQDGSWGWYVGWALLAVALGARNLLRSLQNMAALDVGATLVTIGISAAIVVAYPGWWPI